MLSSAAAAMLSSFLSRHIRPAGIDPPYYSPFFFLFGIFRRALVPQRSQLNGTAPAQMRPCCLLFLCASLFCVSQSGRPVTGECGAQNRMGTLALLPLVPFPLSLRGGGRFPRATASGTLKEGPVVGSKGGGLRDATSYAGVHGQLACLNLVLS